jgi:hypothetical protein
MSMSRPYRVVLNDNSGINRIASGGDGIFDELKDSSLTTVGAGTILAALMAGGLLLRTGPTAAYTDTTDTAANILAAYPGMQVGDTLDFYHCNNVAYVATIAGGTGVTLNTAAGNNTVATNSSKRIHIECTNNTVGSAAFEAYVI